MHLFLGKNKGSSPPGIGERINWEINTPYAGATGMLLHINGKLKIQIICFVVKFRS
jgi:hypothetical protein